MPSRSRRDGGVALILAAAILAVLAILAITFIRIMSIERRASINYVASARAKALANAGIDYAIGALRAKARSHHSSWPLAQRWVYRMRVVDGDTHHVSVGAGLPLENAVYPPGTKPVAVPQIYGGPSFYKGNTGVPDDIDPIVASYPKDETAGYGVYGARIARARRGRPISGWIGGSQVKEGPGSVFVAGTYEDWGDTFSLKVMDCASQINLNMDTAYLEELLDLLGYEIDHYFRRRFDRDATREIERSEDELGQMGFAYPGLFFLSRIGIDTERQTSGLGRWLLARRAEQPNGVFASKEDILIAIQDELAEATYEVAGRTLRTREIAREDYHKLRDFVTVYGFRDRTVIEPGSLMTAQLYALHGIPDREARSPININTASNPVLTAWMRGIAYNKYDHGAYLGAISLDRSELGGAAGLRRAAHLLRRVTFHTPVGAWNGLRTLLRETGEVDESSVGGDLGSYRDLIEVFRESIEKWDSWDRDAVLAMADPNTTLNKFNPDGLVKRRVDKYDLARWTTELCVNSMGYYEIYSLGAITHNGGVVVSQKKIRAVYQIFDQVRKTTQRDFELNRMTTGWDTSTNRPVKLHDKGFWGVVSLPEFRNRFRAYREHEDGKNRYDSADPRQYGYVALYDGCLCFNVLATTDRLGEDDFVAGFNYPLFKNPDSGKSALDGMRPAGPSSMYRRMPGPFRSARSHKRHFRLRMAEPDTINPLSYTRVGEGGKPALRRFSRGSDAFPMGFYADFLRRRALAYDARTAVRGGEVGSVEFWVKPRWEASVGRDSWWYWEDHRKQAIWVFREGRTVFVQFGIGVTHTRTLSYDASHWASGSWHHVHVDWGDTGRLFVDGEEADRGGFKVDGTAGSEDHRGHPDARHMDFGAWPPKTSRAMKTYREFPDKYRSAIEWIERNVDRAPVRYTNSGTHDMWLGYGHPSARGDLWANATIDNVVVRTWRRYPASQVTMPPGELPFRYYPSSYQEYGRWYWQDLTPDLAGFGKDLRLGTAALTIYMPSDSFLRFYMQLGKQAPQEIPPGAG